MLPLVVLAAVYLAGAAAAEPAAPPAFTIRAVSPRAGFLFTDKEPVDVRAQVAGAPGDVTIEYTVSESDGPWRASGKVALGEPGGEKALPLKLPGRGLYHLALTARAGGTTATAETWVAVVFAPPKPDPDSPWGIFYTPPDWFDKENPNGARDVALSHRLLGASWSRLNFWAHSFGRVTVADGDVTADYSLWKTYAKELRREGISIMGEIAQCPRELSSRKEDTEIVGDAGPVYNRVKPADYALWDRLMEKLARDFKDEIQVWEIWNEANLTNRYWTGTVEDLAELIHHTSAALRKGNPTARIAAAGFVGGHAFADRLFELGIGKDLDILTVHYTDENPGAIAQWQALLKKHGLSLPIWNSEEKSEVPARNLAGGIERSFKFIHVSIGYPEYRPLVRKDLTVLPAGILYSVGAHCIGTAKYAGSSDKVPGWETLLFRRGEETVAVFRGHGASGLLGATPRALLEVEPLAAGKAPAVTDAWGRSRPLEVKDGRASLELAGDILFINGCRKLSVAGAEAGNAAGVALFEAESGRWSKGWGANAKPGFSGGRVLELWSGDEPGPDGYWAEVPLTVPEDGTYEVLFSGNSLARLKAPCSISPFTWSLDGGEEHAVKDALPVLTDVRGLPEPPAVLGTAALKKGAHTFRLKLSGRREAYDTNYALWFDAVILREKR